MRVGGAAVLYDHLQKVRAQPARTENFDRERAPKEPDRSLEPLQESNLAALDQFEAICESSGSGIPSNSSINEKTRHDKKKGGISASSERVTLCFDVEKEESCQVLNLKIIIALF